MALSHVSLVFATEDCKIAKLTADPAGGSPTYGTSIDVPGIKSVKISGDIDTKELRGDNTLLSKLSKLTNIQAEVENAKMSLDVLPVILGGATTDSGTTPNQVATYDLLGSSNMNYFKLEAKTPTGGVDTITGDAHFILHKLMLSDFPDLGTDEEDFAPTGFTADAAPLAGTSNKWLSIVLNETAAAIS